MFTGYVTENTQGLPGNFLKKIFRARSSTGRATPS